MAMRELADSSKYPHIVAAMKDIRNEIQRSQGVDPSRPELGRRGTIPHQPDFKHLPPSTTSKEREVAHVEGHSTYKGLGSSDSMEERNEHSQREFGNPILQEKLEHEQFGNEQQFNSEQLGHEQKQPSYRVGDAGTDSNSAWNTIRSANNSQLSAWDRVRKQSGQHSTKSQEQQSYGSWTRPHQQEYDGYHNGGGFASSNGDSGGSVFEGSALSSDDFPRSREDFEGSSSTDDKHKYEFSS
ncbi:hypothetical protein BX070DRAFT_223250 [Coemansia spiralis]|nr:hypothetical protein BX070DRAFT_223250 [Coemansia spiralis]